MRRYVVAATVAVLGSCLVPSPSAGADDRDRLLLTRLSYDGSAVDAFEPFVAGDLLYFAGETAETGNELMVSDGTRAGTRVVADLSPGPQGTEVQPLRAVGDTLYFRARTRTTGTALFRTDGTTAGTSRVGTANVADRATSVLVHDGLVWFSGEDEEHGVELWVTDGTDAGTRLVKDVEPSPGVGSDVTAIGVVGGRVVFTARTHAEGRELWTTDGTAEGTTIVADANPGSADSIWRAPVYAGDRVFYVGQDDKDGDGDGYSDGGGLELWSSDGTAAGTGQVKDIVPRSGSPRIEDVTALGDGVVFSAWTSQDGREPWFSDGTEAGTVMLADVVPGPGGSNTSILERLGRTGPPRLLFRAGTVEDGFGLHVTDGTRQGTTLVVDPRPDADLSYAPGSTAVDGGAVLTVYARRGDGAHLWFTDGTPRGTTRVGPRDHETRYVPVAAGDHVFWLQEARQGTRTVQQLWATTVDADFRAGRRAIAPPPPPTPTVQTPPVPTVTPPRPPRVVAPARVRRVEVKRVGARTRITWRRPSTTAQRPVDGYVVRVSKRGRTLATYRTDDRRVTLSARRLGTGKVRVAIRAANASGQGPAVVRVVRLRR